jgi:hypothetical protein
MDAEDRHGMMMRKGRRARGRRARTGTLFLFTGWVRVRVRVTVGLAGYWTLLTYTNRPSV